MGFDGMLRYVIRAIDLANEFLGNIEWLGKCQLCRENRTSIRGCFSHTLGFGNRIQMICFYFAMEPASTVRTSIENIILVRVPLFNVLVMVCVAGILDDRHSIIVITA